MHAQSGWILFAIGVIVAMGSEKLRAEDAPTTQPVSQFSKSYNLSLQYEPASVYAPPSGNLESEGVNEGGVHVDLDFRCMTDYVYRGLDRSDGTGLSTTGAATTSFGHEDSPNFQFDTKLIWDLGKFPHPYIELFVNVFNDDPVSRFQIVQPIFGLEWNLRPLLVEVGQQTYIYPERDDLNTAEIFTKLTLDDSYFFHTDQPILSPYIYAAYDYDLYDGWYLEAGLKHDFPIEDTGITLTALADVGFVVSNPQFAGVGHPNDDTGFQHYDLGLIGTFSMNSMFNLQRRYGEFAIKGYLFYTSGINPDLLADTQLWGGVGISFKY